jgi:hypothetical protein
MRRDLFTLEEEDLNKSGFSEPDSSGRTDCTMERIGSGTNDLTVDRIDMTSSRIR